MKPASNDLNDLISAAEAELAREPTREATQAAGGAGPARYARWIAVIAALAFSATRFVPLLHTPGKAQTAADLDTIIEQARQGVEAARVAQGKLPDTLPNAALAGLVAYTPVGNNYQLFSASGGVSVTLEPDGRKTVRQGPP